MCKKRTQAGFTVVELALVIVILFVASFSGWYVWRNKHAVPRSTSATVSSTTPKLISLKISQTELDSVTSSWKSYTLLNEGIAFKYPGTWKLINYNASNTVIDGTDNVELESPHDFEVVLMSESYSGVSSCPGPGVVGAEKVTFDGSAGYLNLLSDDIAACSQAPKYNGKVNSVELSTNSRYFVPYQSRNKNIAEPATTDRNIFNTFAGYGIHDISTDGSTSREHGTGNIKNLTISQVVNDPDYRDVPYIIESMSYK